ncbi:hypothetical protein MRX96_028745 [Rhipicephalus microplus]
MGDEGVCLVGGRGGVRERQRPRIDCQQGLAAVCACGGTEQTRKRRLTSLFREHVGVLALTAQPHRQQQVCCAQLLLSSARVHCGEEEWSR